MCNHYHAHLEELPTLEAWRRYVDQDFEERLSKVNSDVWPKREALVARINNGAGRIEAMHWGVPCQVPGKRPGTKLTKHVTNVRNLTSPFWRSMLATPERRCLVPFSAFAEPKIGSGQEEHWFSVKDRPVAAFAGIWRPSEEGNVFAFLTCEPNPLVAPLHPKAMPVILSETDHSAWLTGNWANTQALACSYPSQLMDVQSPAVS